MSRTLNWVTNPNQIPAVQDTLQHRSQSQILLFKTSLESIGWVLTFSSNGTTASSADNVGTTAANINWNSSTAARTHMTFASPVGFCAGLDGSYAGAQSQIYLTLDCNASLGAVGYDRLSVILHKSLPTGGSTSAVPTSAGSQLIGAAQGQYTSNSIVSGHVHFAGISSGQQGNGGFIFILTNSTVVGAESIFSLLPVINNVQIGGLDQPYNFACSLSFSTTANRVIDFTSTTFLLSMKTWNNDGTVGTGSGCISRAPDATCIGYGETNGGDVQQQNTSSDIIFYRTGAKGGIVGVFPDIFGTGATLTDRTVDSVINTQFCYMVGTSTIGYWFPSNAVILN